MTKEALLIICQDQIKVLGDQANVSLLMPGKWGKRSFRRLCPGGPIGNIVSDNFNGPGIIVLFNAREVKDYLSDSS